MPSSTSSRTWSRLCDGSCGLEIADLPLRLRATCLPYALCELYAQAKNRKQLTWKELLRVVGANDKMSVIQLVQAPTLAAVGLKVLGFVHVCATLRSSGSLQALVTLRLSQDLVLVFVSCSLAGNLKDY